MAELRLEPVRCPLCGGGGDGPAASGEDFEYATSGQTFTFVRCAACDLLFLNPRPHADALPAIYPVDYYSFTGEDEPRGVVGFFRTRWERRKVRDYTRWLAPGPRRVLDVGCGTGRLLSLLRDVGEPSWEYRGIELDERAVETARARGFNAERARVEDYRPDGPFDLILLQQVIEHVADPAALLRTLGSWLAPGGVVVLETPNLGGWDYRLFRERLWGGYHFPRHWVLFSRASLRRLAEAAGLDVVEQCSLMSLSFWSWSVHHWMLSRGWPRALVRLARPPSLLLLPPSVMVECLQRETSNQRLVARRP